MIAGSGRKDVLDPLFSIVIVNFNHGQFLEEAIHSVLSQSFSSWELIVVDGGSTDNSVEVIRRNAQSLKWWVSEPDRGQSHAFNKGFGHATGRVFTWLNADDILLPGALESAAQVVASRANAQWIAGNFLRFGSDGKICEMAFGPFSVPRALIGNRSPIPVYGPSSFFSRELFDRVGGLNESLKYAMDTDLWMRFIALGVVPLRLNTYCWAFRMHEGSKTAEPEGGYENPRANEIEREIISVEARNAHRAVWSMRAANFVWRLLTLSELKRWRDGWRWRGKELREFLVRQ